MGLISGYATWGGENIGFILQDWENMGIFAYVLPFILIFAVVFAILDNIKTFEGRKGINLVIAVAVGLLALQFDFVPRFFAEIFPRMGIGLAVLLVALILAGAFIDWEHGKKAYHWIFFGIGALAFLIIIAASFSEYSLFGSGWRQQYGSAIVVLILKFDLIHKMVVADIILVRL